MIPPRNANQKRNYWLFASLKARRLTLRVSRGVMCHEGEGNHTAVRVYNRGTPAFAKSGKVEAAGRDAAEAAKGGEAEQLWRPEQIGRSHSHGEDPAVKLNN